MNSSITQKVGHLAWCALVALSIAEQDGFIRSEIQKNLFLTRWLATAQKQRRFCREVATDINGLLQQGRTLGVRAKLHQKLDYLYRSCTGKLSEQTDLFRLTYALGSVEEKGFYYQLLSEKEWVGRYAAIMDNTVNAIYVTRSALDKAFDPKGRQIAPLPTKISGNIETIREIFHACNWYLTTTSDTATSCLYHLNQITAKNNNPLSTPETAL